MLGVHLDFETKSTTDLIKSGVYRYFEDPLTDTWGFSYRLVKGEPLRQWRPGYPEPTELFDYIRNGGIIIAHNAAFERLCWNTVMRRYFPNAPLLTSEQMDCTMARAAAVSHPQQLGKLCKAINAAENKDMEGANLMKKMAKPRKYNPDGSITWWDAAEDIERVMLYCDQDVRSEESVDDMIPDLTPDERLVWLFDQRINDRGIYLDMKSASRCAELVSLAKKEADKEMRKLTSRSVSKCTSDKQIIEWINSRGIDCTTVKKGEQDDLLFAADIRSDDLVRQVIELRRSAKKTSTAKYAAMEKCVSRDGRARGLLNYHGAGPGRWAGRLIQPQNFPRVDYKREGYIIEWLIDLLHDDSKTIREVYDCITVVHGADAPLRILSRALRSMIKAPTGYKFIGGDFANIEGRKNAWFAGFQKKLDAFRAYDEGTGPDLYKVTAASIAGKLIEEVTDEERQSIGKVPELALGYQGGVGAFIDMGDNYGVDPYEVARVVLNVASPEQWDETAAGYSKATDKNDLQEREWTAIKIIVNNWRTANAPIVKTWWEYQDAAVLAVSAPGEVVHCVGGKISYYSDGRCLWCRLPSGRMICYAFPSIEEEMQEYFDKFTGEAKVRLKRKVVFWGYKEGQWKKLSLYGGLQCENIVQGSSRCVMVNRMFAVEAAGYPIILTVHDEILAEVRDDLPHLNDKEFQKIMSEVPACFAGLPLSAKAWEDERYVK